MKVLSLYDGMSCGSIAFKNLGIEVDEYIAYEIDKYAIAVTQHNFPNVIQMGDVYGADFTQHKDIDWLIGGFPCTKFSIAQKNDRETEPYSGLGWELFMHYKRALNEAKPKYFLAENNKSMAKPIRDEISRLFGFEPTCINSALVSAQNRQRLYWVGVRQADGTYRKCDIEQPEDRGILLRDVLDSAVAWQEKSYCIDANYYKGGNLSSFTKQSGMRFMTAEPVNTTIDGKAQTIRATCYKDGIRNMVGNNIDRKTCVAEPVCVAQRGRYASNEIVQHYEPREDGKTNAITTVQKDNAVCEPVRIGDLPNDKGEISGSQATRIYAIEGKSVNLVANGGGQGAKTGLYAVPVGETISDEYFKGGFDGELIGMIESNSIKRNGKQPPQWTRIYSCDGKSVCVDTDQRKYCMTPIENVNLVPFVEKSMDEIVEKFGYLPEMFNPYNRAEISDKHPTFTANGGNRQTDSSSVFIVERSTQPVYEVLNGLITIKGKQYPIKLADGYYIIRKLTVSECKRLQTVPDWYDFSVISNSQAYKCLGNAWTVDVIVHLIESSVNT